MEILDYKYKQRDPKETVQIVQKFFKDRGFTLNLKDESKSEAGTYSCHIELFYEGDFIIFSNGKGVTRELCLASGYAEMYERFCNKMCIYTHKSSYHKLKQETYENCGYCVHPEEKILSYEEVLADNQLNEFYSYAANYNDTYKRNLLNAISNNDFIGIPYKNVIAEEVKYYDPQLLLRMLNSVGMCAGNTFKEAFNEGFSEILEHNVLVDLICSNGLKKYYAININSLDNDKLKECYHDIMDAGYNFYLVDLSFNYNFPVIMGLLVDPKAHYTRLNFGSFPVFEIAAMRTITELWQNRDVYDRNWDLLQIPTEHCFEGDYLLDFHRAGLANAPYFPPHFFTNLCYTDNYNTNVFMQKNSTVDEIYAYYETLIKKNNLNVYYNDNSLMDKLTSLHIYVDNLIDYCPITSYNVKELNYDLFFSILYTDMKYEHMIYNEQPNFDNADFEDCLKVKDTGYDESLLFVIMYYNPVYPMDCLVWPTIDIMLDQEKLEDDTIVRKYKNMIIFPIIKKYYTIRRYLDCGYTYKEMIPIMKGLGINDFTEEDYNNTMDNNYLFIKTVLEPSWQHYHSDKYKNYLMQYIKK